MDRGAWRVAFPGIAELDSTEQLTHMHAFTVQNTLLIFKDYYKVSFINIFRIFFY